MSEEELIRAVERECDMLERRGRTVAAADGRRVVATLRQALREHQVALDEVIRCENRTKSPDRTSGDLAAWGTAQATMRERWATVTAARDHAQRFLDAPH